LPRSRTRARCGCVGWAGGIPSGHDQPAQDRRRDRRSTRGDDALAFAAELARTVGTGLLLVHAYAPGETRAQANAILEARRADVCIEIVAYADPSPARALHRVAAARRASLIVVGPSHRAGLGLVLPGSTAQQLLEAGIRAVAVVPAGWRPRPDAPLRRIGCGYDGSLQADAALETAAELSRAVEGSLDVMRAFWSAPLSGALGIAAAADLEARGAGRSRRGNGIAAR
jgi:nucleotide-binding universal stress UspA family protein